MYIYKQTQTKTINVYIENLLFWQKSRTNKRPSRSPKTKKDARSSSPKTLAPNNIRKNVTKSQPNSEVELLSPGINFSNAADQTNQTAEKSCHQIKFSKRIGAFLSKLMKQSQLGFLRECTEVPNQCRGLSVKRRLQEDLSTDKFSYSIDGPKVTEKKYLRHLSKRSQAWIWWEIKDHCNNDSQHTSQYFRI